MTYCRGCSDDIADMRNIRQVQDRRGAQLVLPCSSPACPRRTLLLSAAALPLPGLPRPRLSPSTQGAPVPDSPSRPPPWSTLPRAARRSADCKLATRCSPFCKHQSSIGTFFKYSFGSLKLMVNLLLHSLVLLILQCSELNHLLDVLVEIIYLQLQSVAIQVFL